jgi:hypothetical protein
MGYCMGAEYLLQSLLTTYFGTEPANTRDRTRSSYYSVNQNVSLC